MRTCVIGVGNELRSDDGIGPRIVDALQSVTWGETVDFLALGPDLVGMSRIVGRYDHVFIIDALSPGVEPGRIQAEHWEATRGSFDDTFSLHDMDLLSQISWIRRESVKKLWIIGVETASFDWGIGLSPAMEGVFSSVVHKVSEAIRERLSDGLVPESVRV